MSEGTLAIIATIIVVLCNVGIALLFITDHREKPPWSPPPDLTDEDLDWLRLQRDLSGGAW